MKYFAQSACDYIRSQLSQHANREKLLFMMPSVPPAVVKDIGDGLAAYVFKQTLPRDLSIKVAKPLVDHWRETSASEGNALLQDSARADWFSDNESLTKYRSKTDFGPGGAV
ncbi:MAG: hypothetical protein EOP84_24405, partial [Verrucomicrobiaceae bacterium]